MSKNLSKTNNSIIVTMFEKLDIYNVTPKDKFTITYKDGLLEANVKYASGHSVVAVKQVKGGFNETTTFDPERMTKDERNALIRNYHLKGRTQNELAKMFGLSQAMISRITGISLSET